MHTRPIARIALLAVTAAAVALSCSIDYTLDFALTDMAHADHDVKVDVGYSMINNGMRSMDNVSIHILVTIELEAGGPEQKDQWVPTGGVDLTVGGKHSDTITFTFSGPFTDHVEEIIGARWDEYTSSY